MFCLRVSRNCFWQLQRAVQKLMHSYNFCYRGHILHFILLAHCVIIELSCSHARSRTEHTFDCRIWFNIYTGLQLGCNFLLTHKQTKFQKYFFRTLDGLKCEDSSKYRAFFFLLTDTILAQYFADEKVKDLPDFLFNMVNNLSFRNPDRKNLLFYFCPS